MRIELPARYKHTDSTHVAAIELKSVNSKNSYTRALRGNVTKFTTPCEKIQQTARERERVRF